MPVYLLFWSPIAVDQSGVTPSTAVVDAGAAGGDASMCSVSTWSNRPSMPDTVSMAIVLSLSHRLLSDFLRDLTASKPLFKSPAETLSTRSNWNLSISPHIWASWFFACNRWDRLFARSSETLSLMSLNVSTSNKNWASNCSILTSVLALATEKCLFVLLSLPAFSSPPSASSVSPIKGY